ncbi:MAG TPA: hypothetical protein VLU41_04545 [Ideonella sp.]|nr:hypothetical protein [Ideonella sp.]
MTSQAPLRLAAERVYRIGALSVPQGRLPAAEALSFGAVALFAERAQQVDARFVLGDANAPAVIELCRALDGLALAIELAAARAPTLGLKQLAASMHARLRLLGAGHNRSAPARQQTLRAALDWSHGLLEPREQAVFRRLGVLAGAADLALIQQVASDERHDEWAVIDALSLLVDRSLVTVLASHEAELPRYRLLDSPRAYALERLQAAGELQATRRRHAQAMAARFEAAWRDRFSGRIGVDSWRLGLEPDFDDAREAFEWARDQGDAALALAIGATLVLGMPRSNHAEVLALTDACEALLGADVPAPQTLAMRVALAWRWSDTRPQRALGAAREAVRVARSLGEADRFGLYCALTLCALTAATVEDHALAASALAEARTIEDRGWPAQRLLLAAEADYVVAIASGAEAAHCLQLARAQLALSQRAGYEGVAAELSIADAELMAGDAQSALRHGLAVLARLKGTRREAELALARLNIVASRLARDDTAEARALASVGWAQAQHLDQQAWWADYLSLLCALEARPRAAAKLAGYADATYRRHEDRRQPNESGAVERALALARSTLGADAVQRLVAEGALLRDDQVATLAFAMTDG